MPSTKHTWPLIDLHEAHVARKFEVGGQEMGEGREACELYRLGGCPQRKFEVARDG